MPITIEALQHKRTELLNELCSLEEFRRGTISVNYRKCGKSGCRCSREGEKGHGPQILWNATIAGKSVAKNLRTGAEVEKHIQETERYKRFMSLSEELVRVNEQLCDMRPVRHIENEEDLEALKKNCRNNY